MTFGEREKAESWCEVGTYKWASKTNLNSGLIKMKTIHHPIRFFNAHEKIGHTRNNTTQQPIYHLKSKSHSSVVCYCSSCGKIRKQLKKEDFNFLSTLLKNQREPQ